MNKSKEREEILANFRRFKIEFQEFCSLFVEAFNELHNSVIVKITCPETYVPPYLNYPIKTISDFDFPSFYSNNRFDNRTPKYYVGAVRQRPIVDALLGKYGKSPPSFPAGDNLKAYLRTHEIGKKLWYSNHEGEMVFSDFVVDQIVNSAVEKYLHRHGVDAPVDPMGRGLILKPLMQGVVGSSHKLTLMVPIALTKFDFRHYRLSDTAYLMRIPEGLQLSRGRMQVLGSGASEPVVHAATHAFVSNGWTMDVDKVVDVWNSLSLVSQNELDAVDEFLGALRVVTGVKTGYAQVLWVPRGWALDYYCDLPPLNGVTIRQYSGEFDDFGWKREPPSISIKEMESVCRVYKELSGSKNEKIRLALARLNSCLTRVNPSDAVLDATIGLELLLGDDQNQSLAYKLRLRAAALSWLDASAGSAVDISDKVKKVYTARSEIVHGLTPKRKKKIGDNHSFSRDDDRQLAAQLLSFVLRVLLAHPDYLEPSKIDSGLILRGATDASNQPKL